MSKSSYERKLLHEQAQALRSSAKESKARTSSEYKQLIQGGRRLGIPDEILKGYAKHTVKSAQGKPSPLGMTEAEKNALSQRQVAHLVKFNDWGKREVGARYKDQRASNAEVRSRSAGQPDGPIRKFGQRLLNAINGKGWHSDESLQEKARQEQTQESYAQSEGANSPEEAVDQMLQKPSTPEESVAAVKAGDRTVAGHVFNPHELDAAQRGQMHGHSKPSDKKTAKDDVIARNKAAGANSPFTYTARVDNAANSALATDEPSPLAGVSEPPVEQPAVEQPVTTEVPDDDASMFRAMGPEDRLREWGPQPEASHLTDTTSPLTTTDAESTGLGVAVGEVSLTGDGSAKTFDQASAENTEDFSAYEQFSAAAPKM
jgi:hypothetical protein